MTDGGCFQTDGGCFRTDGGCSRADTGCFRADGAGLMRDGTGWSADGVWDFPGATGARADWRWWQQDIWSPIRNLEPGAEHNALTGKGEANAAAAPGGEAFQILEMDALIAGEIDRPACEELINLKWKMEPRMDANGR